MKSILVIGMGRFGQHLAYKMQALGNDVMIVDRNEGLINSLAPDFIDAQIGDCTDKNVVEALGVDSFDICFVCMGEDFQSSVVVTSLLKSHGAKYVISKATHAIQHEVLFKVGADEVVYPEKEIAEKVAVRCNAKNIFDYIKLTSEYSIYEIPILDSWVGKTIVEINVRKRHKVNIVAVIHNEKMQPMPGADYVFGKGDRITVIGKADDVFKISAKVH